MVESREAVIDDSPDQSDEADDVIMRDEFLVLFVQIENNEQNEEYNGADDQRRDVLSYLYPGCQYVVFRVWGAQSEDKSVRYQICDAFDNRNDQYRKVDKFIMVIAVNV